MLAFQRMLCIRLSISFIAWLLKDRYEEEEEVVASASASVDPSRLKIQSFPILDRLLGIGACAPS